MFFMDLSARIIKCLNKDMSNNKSTMLLSYFAFCVSLIPILLANEENDFVEVKVRPWIKYLDSNGLSSEYDMQDMHHRAVRKPSTCKFPTVMSDSQLDCKLYPSRVECVQTCMFGHTLSDGIQRVMKCKYEEDRWSPKPDFEKCLPFVDCSVTLGPGGKYKCHTNFMDKGTICEISCAHYEDKPAIAAAQYQCNVDGSWSPKLPFCARPGSGVKLAPPPSGLKFAHPK